jgi:uncharacterized membrane protein YgcG
MKRLVLTVAVTVGALFSLPVQAAPLATGASTLQAQVRPEAQQVYHCRSWSDGWNCGWGNLRQEHSRYWSHRRSGSEGSGGSYSGGGGGYEGFGHLRTKSHHRSGSSNYEGEHDRHMSHQRTESWKKRF